MTTRIALHRSLTGALVALALVTAACGGASAPASPRPSDGTGGSTLPPAAAPTPVPGSSTDPSVLPGGGGSGGNPGSEPGGGPGSGGSGGAGGAVPGNPGAGVVVPGEPGDPGAGVPVPGAPGIGVDPTNPEPSIVTPVAGATGVRQVSAVKIEAAVSGRDVAVRVAWWSGVEPCSVLAGITVTRDGNTFLVTVNEGSAAGPDTMCIEIALYKAAIVDLGELDPGTYTIKAFGDAAPIEVTVAG